MRKILIVDDEVAILDMLVAVLEDEGYVVIPADSGLRALELLPKERPDLVLLDIMMPGMDGREVCRRMREIPGSEDTRVIIISAAIRPDLSGCTISGFLSKPFDLDQLLTSIDRVLGTERAGESPRAPHPSPSGGNQGR